MNLDSKSNDNNNDNNSLELLKIDSLDAIKDEMK